MVLLIPKSEVESLQAFVDYSGGEIMKKTKPRGQKRKRHGDSEALEENGAVSSKQGKN